MVSVFWSLMVDIFDNEQAKRLFGVIAAGGTVGALAGPALAGVLVLHLGPANLLLVSAALLGWTVVCTRRLIAWRASAPRRPDGDLGKAFDAASERALGGSVWAGLRLVAGSPYLSAICLFILLVYRGGDAVSAWAFAGLQAPGLTAAGIALVAVPLSAVWAYSGFRLGRRRERLEAQQSAREQDQGGTR